MFGTKFAASILKEVAGPLFRRVGSVLAVALIARGVSEEHASLLLASFGAFAAVSFDVLVVLINRKANK